jgi:hypothetical protein
MKPPTRDELMALKRQEEAKREAYLRRRFTPDELWRWQQASTDALAKLRSDLAQRLRLPSDPEQASKE